MKKVNIKIAAAGFFLLLGLSSQAQAVQQVNGQLTLKQCVETAIQNNLAVRQSEYQAQSDKVSYHQAKGNQLPFIAGSVYHGINQGAVLIRSQIHMRISRSILPIIISIPASPSGTGPPSQIISNKMN